MDDSEQFDFAFIDADKTEYIDYFEETLKRLRPNGLIMLDNTLRGGSVLDPGDSDAARVTAELNDRLAEDDRVDVALLGVADGITLVRKTVTARARRRRRLVRPRAREPAAALAALRRGLRRRDRRGRGFQAAIIAGLAESLLLQLGLLSGHRAPARRPRRASPRSTRRRGSMPGPCGSRPRTSARGRGLSDAGHVLDATPRAMGFELSELRMPEARPGARDPGGDGHGARFA